MRENLDSHLAQTVVDVRVVDDLANEKDPPVRNFRRAWYAYSTARSTP
jgi:hypothetical protein